MSDYSVNLGATLEILQDSLAMGLNNGYSIQILYHGKAYKMFISFTSGRNEPILRYDRSLYIMLDNLEGHLYVRLSTELLTSECRIMLFIMMRRYRVNPTFSLLTVTNLYKDFLGAPALEISHCK